jgi:hypothetical protein
MLPELPVQFRPVFQEYTKFASCDLVSVREANLITLLLTQQIPLTVEFETFHKILKKYFKAETVMNSEEIQQLLQGY